jgi:hypothetical protein
VTGADWPLPHFLWNLTHDNVLREGVMAPPDQPRLEPDALSLTPSRASLEAVERRVTIYTRGLVWDRVQATWVRVFRGPHAQYADAFHLECKPKGKRRIGSLIEGYKPSVIILAGWHHPDVRPRILLPGGEPTLAPEASSVTVDGPAETDMDRIVDRYVRSLPAADVILDLRGHIVATGRKWS